MKWKPTLVLLVVVAAVAAVAYHLSRKPTSSELAAQAERLLPGLRAEDVRELEIKNEAGRLFCVRGPLGDEGAPGALEWRIAGPFALRADQEEVGRIVETLAAARTYGRPTAIDDAGPGALAEFGLDEPARQATLRTAAGGGWSVRLGNRVGVKEHSYAIGGDDGLVRSVDSEVADALGATLDRVRSKRLLEPIPPGRLTGLEVRVNGAAGGEELRIICTRSRGVWRMEEPVRDLVSEGLIEVIAERLSHDSIPQDDFVGDGPEIAAVCGLEKPDVVITFRLPDGDLTAAFASVSGGEEAACYAMNAAETGVVRIPKSLFDGLPRTPADLRSRSLVSFSPEDVERLTISGPEGGLALRRTGDGWTITDPSPDAAADGPTIRAILDGLRDAQAVDFAADAPVDLAPYGLDGGHCREVTLYGADDRVLGKALFGAAAPDGRHLYASRPGQSVVLSFGRAALFDDLLGGRLRLLDRQVLVDQGGEAYAVATARDGQQFRCRRDPGRPASLWRLIEPAAGLADSAAAQGVAQRLADLRCQGYAAESAADIEPYGLQAPWLTAEASYLMPLPLGSSGSPSAQGEGYSRKLMVGGEADGGLYYAKLAAVANERVFLVTADTVNALSAPLASRAICQARGVRRLEFRQGGRVLIFTRARGAAEWADWQGEAVGDEMQARLAAVADLLRNFEGERIAAYELNNPADFGLARPTLVLLFDDPMARGKRLEVGSEAEGGGYYVMGAMTSFVLVAAEGDVDKLLAAVESAPAP